MLAVDVVERPLLHVVQKALPMSVLYVPRPHAAHVDWAAVSNPFTGNAAGKLMLSGLAPFRSCVRPVTTPPDGGMKKVDAAAQSVDAAPCSSTP